MECLSPKVTPEMNSLLMRPFSKEDVEMDLNQIHHVKAPGPDGMLAL